MALAFKCDLCGKFFLYDKNGITKVDINTYKNITGDLSVNNKYEICPECKDELYAFIMSKKENKNESSHT